MKLHLKSRRGRNNYLRGLIGEFFAIIYLKLNLYNIVARRYKTKLGEIDIIAEKNGVIIFCEIKSGKQTNNFEIVSEKQKMRIIRAASYYLSYKNPLNNQVRFDVLLIKKFFFIKHIKNAWQSDNFLAI